MLYVQIFFALRENPKLCQQCKVDLAMISAMKRKNLGLTEEKESREKFGPIKVHTPFPLQDLRQIKTDSTGKLGDMPDCLGLDLSKGANPVSKRETEDSQQLPEPFSLWGISSFFPAL